MGSLSIWHWLIVAVYIALSVIPAVLILHKAGFSGWWSILTVIPLANIAAPWIFAFVKWPVTSEQPPR